MSNKLNIRKIEEKDYEFINKWWQEVQLDTISREILPMNGLGGLIIEKEKPIAVSYLYLTNSKVAYVDNLIVNPSYNNKDRFKVVSTLIEACARLAKQTGCIDIWAMSNSRGVLQRCKNLGAIISEEKYKVITYSLNKK